MARIIPSTSKWPQTYCPRCNSCGDSRKCRVCKFTKFPKSGPANMHKWEGTWPAR